LEIGSLRTKSSGFRRENLPLVLPVLELNLARLVKERKIEERLIVPPRPEASFAPGESSCSTEPSLVVSEGPAQRWFVILVQLGSGTQSA